MDILRGIAILAVVAIHVSYYFYNINPINTLAHINIIIYVFSQFAVPLFIFISGYVLSNKYYDTFSLKHFYAARARSILPSYIIFSIFYTSYPAFYHHKIPTTSEIIHNIFSGESVYTFWFFILIMQLYILYPIIIKIYKLFEDYDKSKQLLLFTLLAQIAYIIIATLQGIHSEWSLFISYVFYFLLGIYADKNTNAFPYTKYAFISSIIITFFIYRTWVEGIVKYGTAESIPAPYFLISNAMQPLLYSTIIISLYNCVRYSESLTLKALGNYSFGIYLIHIFFMNIIVLLFRTINLSANNPLFYILLFVTTVLLSYIAVGIMIRIPFGDILMNAKIAPNQPEKKSMQESGR